MLVLLHDLCNINSDRAAAARTTDEVYNSAPNFTPEAALIKATPVPPPTLSEVPGFGALALELGTT